MIRNILAVIAGNAAWTVLWLGYNAILKGASFISTDATRRLEGASALLSLLGGSVVFSIIAGYITAAIATGGTYWPVLVLCAVQIAMGIFFQAQSWKLMPIWYHIHFVLLLGPATLLGAWLRLN